jgi:hypothetical protein
MQTVFRSVIRSLFIFCLVATGNITANTKAPAEPSMPQGLWEAFDEARHEIFNREDTGRAHYYAQSPANGLMFDFGVEGPSIKPNDPAAGWIVGFSLTAWGQEGRMQALPAAELIADGRRIEYRRGPVTEWYINHSNGLEQGFDLERPDDFATNKPLLLVINLQTELSAEIRNMGRDLAFLDNNGKEQFTYAGLKVFDTAGRELPADLSLTNQKLSISIEVGNAPWPIRVDPLISSQIRLRPTETKAGALAQFGYSVALSGDWAVIGAPQDVGYGAGDGAAYAFRKVAESWLFERRLRQDFPPIDLGWAAASRFGHSVDVLSGASDFIAVGAPGCEIETPTFQVEATGCVYVFYPSAGWGVSTLYPESGNTDTTQFGYSVAFDPITKHLAVGAPGFVFDHDKDEGTPDIEAGAVFVYWFDGSYWSRFSVSAPLTGSESGGGSEAESTPERFGEALDFEDGHLLVGAPFEDYSYTDAGVFYSFACSDSGGWSCAEEAPINDEPALNEKLGMDISLSGVEVLVGTDAEVAYIYEAGSAPFYYFMDHVFSNGSSPPDDTGFGLKVSFSGTSALVAAKYDDDGGPDAGAAYIFDLNQSGGYEQKAKLVPTSRQDYAEFGSDVAHDGINSLIGSARYEIDGLSAAGMAYLFTFENATWNQIYALSAIELADLVGEFGYCVGMSGDSALVGSPSESSNKGGAYVFSVSENRWSLQQRLIHSGAAAGDKLGVSCALDGNTAILGSWAGAAFVFQQSGGTWSQQATLIGSDTSSAVNTEFASAVALSGDTAVVGQPVDDGDARGSTWGAAYVFTRSGTSWGQQQKLVSSDAASGDRFGSAVNVDGDTAIIGAQFKNSNRGSAYIFTRSGSSWTEEDILSGSDSFPGDNFSLSVAVKGDVALVGAPNADINTGEVFVFTRSGSTWSQRQKLLASNASTGEWFGYDVDLYGRNAFVGAPASTGTAYIFAQAGNSWVETHNYQSSVPFSSDNFAQFIDADGNHVLAGAPLASGSGSAYIDRFDCGFGAAIQAGRWNMIGIPCDLGSSNTVADVFGDTLDTNRYNIDWTMYRRDAANDRYVRLSLASALSQDEGYWLYSRDWANWDVTGTATTWTMSGTCASPTGCYEVPLTKPADASGHRFVMVGHPGNRNVNWSGVTVMVDGTALTPYEAEVYNYLSKTFWKWNGASYDTWDDGTTPGMEGTLYSHEGIWVKVLGDSFSLTTAPRLLIPNQFVAGGPPAPPGMSAVSAGPQEASFESSTKDRGGKGGKQKAPEEWFITLSASGDGLQDRRNVLGQMISSEDGLDSRDLEELRPEFDNYLTIVFPHDDWQNGVTAYSSDYHDTEMGRSDSWDFEVRSDATWRDVTIAWDRVMMVNSYWNDRLGRWAWVPDTETNTQPLVARMWLMDVDTGALIKAEEDGTLNSYTFNMGGSEVRHFRWIYSKKGNPAK